MGHVGCASALSCLADRLGVVNARDDILAKVEAWLSAADESGTSTPPTIRRPKAERGKSGELVALDKTADVDQLDPSEVVDFDYCRYALCVRRLVRPH